MNSYRPISNLTFLSNTVEWVVAIRFVEHAELHGLMPHHQSAYRSFHSTETTVLAVHNSIVRTIDSGKLCALVLLDLSAAFDTVDHPIMLLVLHDRFCVKDTALKWVRVISQWSNTDLPGQGSTFSPSHSRLQCTAEIGNGTSEIQRLHRRSDKPHRRPSSGSSHVCGRHSTYRVYNVSDIPNAIMKLQNCVEAIHEWCRSRRLQLNPAKTDLVRIKSQFEEDCSSWSELVYWSWHHKASWCCPRSKGLLRQWTEHGSACKDRRPQLFFSIFDVSNQSGASSAEKLHWAWCQLSWQPGSTTVTPSLQDFLRWQSIHFNESRTQLPN